LALEIEGAPAINEKEFKNTLWSTVIRLFGEFGASKTGIVLVKYDAVKNRAVLRCANTALEMVRASLVSITEIDAKPAAVHVLGISGTIKSLYRKFP
jgi:ribonuclease P/MRP protein subunit POP5